MSYYSRFSLFKAYDKTYVENQSEFFLKYKIGNTKSLMRKYRVSLPSSIAEYIFMDGVERYPNEACGIILGRVIDDVFTPKEAHKAKNLSDNPIRFILDPKDFIKIQDYADRNNLEIIGIYHTHPDHPPIASQYDLQAAVEGLVYIIMSIWERKKGDTKAFILSDHNSFIEIPIDWV